MISTLLLMLLLVVLMAGFSIVIFAMSRQMRDLKQDMKDDSALGLIKQDLQGINQTLNDRLDKSNASMNEAISRQFNASSRLIGEVTSNLTELKESNKRVMSITEE